MLAYHFNSGSIEGLDVAGLTKAGGPHTGKCPEGQLPGGDGSGRKATPQQEEAILEAYRGSLGGPLEDMSKLIGEVVAIERASITFEVNMGNGTLKIGQSVEAQVEPYRGPSGQVTTLNESIFSTIPGSPAYVAKALAGEPNTPHWVLTLT